MALATGHPVGESEFPGRNALPGNIVTVFLVGFPSQSLGVVKIDCACRR